MSLFIFRKLKDFFVSFSEYVKERYDARPGFITMNMPLLVDVLEERNVEKPLICSSINKLNFRMSGGIDLYRTYLAEKDIQVIAMQVLAAGAIRPEEAIEFIGNLKGVDAVLFGASSPNHILDTKNLIEKYL